MKSLSAIYSLVGKPIMTDKIIKNGTWLKFVRVLIKVKLKHDVVEEIHFVNEFGQPVSQVISYDVIPMKCGCCNGFWHKEVDCKKKKEDWKVKVVHVINQSV